MSGPRALTSAGSTRRWRRLRLWVLNRDGWACQAAGEVPAISASWATVYAPAGWPRAAGRPLVCGAYADHADHVVPRHAGGSDDVSNLRATCPPHNLSKGAKLEDATGVLPDPAHQLVRATRWEWS